MMLIYYSGQYHQPMSPIIWEGNQSNINGHSSHTSLLIVPSSLISTKSFVIIQLIAMWWWVEAIHYIIAYIKSSGVGNDSNPSTPPLPLFQNSFKAIASAVREIYDPQEKASSSSQASSSSSAYRPPHRFSLRYLNIVDPVDVANNLGISVSLKNSKAIQMILFHASQHLESLHCWSMPHHASRVPSSSSSSHPPQQPALHLSAPHPSYGNVALTIATNAGDTNSPTLNPSAAHPSLSPSSNPSFVPSWDPTLSPTVFPTNAGDTNSPTLNPSAAHPSLSPSSNPSFVPSRDPTLSPTVFPRLSLVHHHIIILLFLSKVFKWILTITSTVSSASDHTSEVSSSSPTSSSPTKIDCG